jgi:hypothetical protein
MTARSELPGSLEDAPVNSSVGCAVPTLVRYTDDYEATAEKELQAIYKTQPHVAEMINDYRKLRAAIRKIRPSQ